MYSYKSNEPPNAHLQEHGPVGCRMVLHVITNPLKKLLIQILETNDHLPKPHSPRSLLLQTGISHLRLLGLLEGLLILTDVE